MNFIRMTKMDQQFCHKFVRFKTTTPMLNVAIVCGGDSGEYEVSLNSGGQVFQHLDREKFIPFLVVVRKEGWICRLEWERSAGR